MLVIKQLSNGSPAVKCAQVALRYAVTSIVALLLVLIMFALESWK
jgi:hypothetical protein